MRMIGRGHHQSVDTTRGEQLLMTGKSPAIGTGQGGGLAAHPGIEIRIVIGPP